MPLLFPRQSRRQIMMGIQWNYYFLIVLVLVINSTGCEGWMTTLRSSGGTRRSNPHFLAVTTKQTMTCSLPLLSLRTTSLLPQQSSSSVVIMHKTGNRFSLNSRSGQNGSFLLHNKSNNHRRRNRRRLTWFLAVLTASILTTVLLSPKSAAAAAAAAAASVGTEGLSTAAVTGMTTTMNAATAIPATSLNTLQYLQAPISPLVELQLTFRLLFSALLGAAVGKERSSTHKHSAGVRTMALVALGACAFTVCSSFGFRTFGRYDPSRMASNVASGVGFVGAGVITTTSGAANNNNNNNNRNNSPHSIVVHGLTTATAIWISAAIGVACGVGLFYISTVATVSTIAILRFGCKKKKNRKQQPWHRGNSGSEQYHPEPDVPARAMSSLTTTVELEKMNEDDEWDSHYEKHDEEDDDEEEEEEEEEEVYVRKGDRPNVASQHHLKDEQGKDEIIQQSKESMEETIKKQTEFELVHGDLSEYHAESQAKILEQAHAVSWGNVTELASRKRDSNTKNQIAFPSSNKKQRDLIEKDQSNSNGQDEHLAP